MKRQTIEISMAEKVPRNIRTVPAYHWVLHLAALKENKDMGDLFAELVVGYLQAKHPELLADLAQQLTREENKGK